MSRIHEALKKAEQERAALQGGPAQPSFATVESPVAPRTNFRPAEVCALARGQRATERIGDAVVRQSLSASMPLLARCPQLQWKPDEKTMLFFNGDDNARGTEEFRTLRSRLYSLREKMTLKKLLVTSALPKEGKSFTAANLAQVMVRQHGRRVLLIDADLRGPRLHMMLGNDFVSRLVGLPAGSERRVFHHAARADGKPVLHSQRPGDFRSRRAGGQRAAEVAVATRGGAF